MRTLKIIEHISLDGVIQVSGDDGDFPYGDWTAAHRTPAGRDAMMAAHGESFDLLLGRRTYDAWSGFWPKAPSSLIAGRLNAATKFVATQRPESLAWGPFEGLGPDIAEGIRRIKSQDGPALVLSGSSTLTSMVLERGLADEAVLAVYPAPVGRGQTFLCGGNPGTLIRARQHASNAVRRHPQYLQDRWAFEGRIVRRHDIAQRRLTPRSSRPPMEPGAAGGLRRKQGVMTTPEWRQSFQAAHSTKISGAAVP